MPISRTRITMTTHHASSSSNARQTSAPPVRSLSAMGSMSLPKSVTRLRLRAMCPSMLSVAMPTTKNAAASQRRALLAPSSARSIQKKAGAIRMRTIVMMFGTLSTLDGVSPALITRPRSASGSPNELLPVGQLPGILGLGRLDLIVAARHGRDRIERLSRLHRGLRRLGGLLAAQGGEHPGQLLRRHEHIAGLRALGRPDDL